MPPAIPTPSSFLFSHTFQQTPYPQKLTQNQQTPRRRILAAPRSSSLRAPPLDFDYKSEVLDDSRLAIASTHPQLMDLVDDGSLIVVPKRRFGPVPSWRSEFVEPESIWLLGTSHLAEKSAIDVDRVVRAVKPDNVVVELCRSRAGIMYASNSSTESASLFQSNMFSLSGAGFFGAVSRSLNLGGQSALALRWLLAVFSSKVSSVANRPFGDEFRAARRVAEDVGSQIVLGDRPIEITLERAWSSLKWSEKLRLVTLLLRGISFSESELPNNNIKDGETDGDLFKLYEKLSMSYPSLLQPLIYERDMYLAWSLKRSKAVNNSNKVVGVIGKGHMSGVIYALISDQGDLRFRDLVGRKAVENSIDWVTSLLKSLVRDTILGIILWILYEQLKDGQFQLP